MKKRGEKKDKLGKRIVVEDRREGKSRQFVGKVKR